MRFPLSGEVEKFLVLEVSPRKTRGLLLKLDKEKKLTPREISEFEKPRDFFSAWKFDQAQWTIIVSADPLLAVTVRVPISLDRGKSPRPLTSSELENFLGQAVGRTFNEERRAASKKLSADEAETVLIDSRVVRLESDGHEVVTPVGLPARSIEGIIELIFVRRDFYEDLRFLSLRHRRFFFTEMSRAHLGALLKVCQPPFHAAVLRPDFSFLFSLESDPLGTPVFRGTIEWSSTVFVEAICAMWEVNPPVARKIFASYSERELSSRIAQKLEHRFRPIVEDLFSKIKSRRLRGRVFFSSGEGLPSVFPERHASLMFEEPPLSLLFEKTGFRINAGEWKVHPQEIFSRLAPFFEFYYDKSDGPASHWLRRRLHWLGAIPVYKS